MIGVIRTPNDRVPVPNERSATNISGFPEVIRHPATPRERFTTRRQLATTKTSGNSYTIVSRHADTSGKTYMSCPRCFQVELSDALEGNHMKPAIHRGLPGNAAAMVDKVER